MTEERLNSILGKFQEASVAREKRETEAAEKERIAAETAASVKERWPAILTTIKSEVANLNSHLQPLGYKLHTGTEQHDDQFPGSITVGFDPIGHREGRLDRLKFIALETGTFRSGFGTKNMSPAGSDAGPLDQLDEERIRKTLLDFLEKNIPS